MEIVGVYNELFFGNSRNSGEIHDQNTILFESNILTTFKRLFLQKRFL